MSVNKLIDGSNDRKHFTVIPRIVWALCSDPYELALWMVIKDIAGESGECILGTPELASMAMMSAGKVHSCRKSLIDKGLIQGTVVRDPGYPQPVWHLTIPDLWSANSTWCEHFPTIRERIDFKAKKSVHHMNDFSKNSRERSPGEKGTTPGERGTTPGERKKNLKEDLKRKTIWGKVLDELKDEVRKNPPRIVQGIKESVQISLEESANQEPHVLQVMVPDEFTRQWCEERLAKKAARIAAGFLAHPVEIWFVVADE